MFFLIPDFAVNSLDLSGNNLLIFSLIYSFKRPVKLSYKVIANRVNCSRRSAINSITFLLENDLIKSEKLNNTVNNDISTYYINGEKISPLLSVDSEKNSESSEKNSPNNNINNLNNLNNMYISASELEFINAKKRLAENLTSSAYYAWVEDIDFISYSDNILNLSARTQMVINQFKLRYMDMFLNLLNLNVSELIFSLKA